MKLAAAACMVEADEEEGGGCWWWWWWFIPKEMFISWLLLLLLEAAATLTMDRSITSVWRMEAAASGHRLRRQARGEMRGRERWMREASSSYT
jgi:hypothetical protein